MINLPQSLRVHRDLSSAELLEAALARNEGILASNGALTVTTGKRTGRSPKDRFIVEDLTTQGMVDWGKINQPLAPSVFNQLWDKALDILTAHGEAFVSHHQVGADPAYAIPVDVITEHAWHTLFVQNLFISPHQNLTAPAWTILSVPSYQPKGPEDGVNGDAIVALDFTEHRILICGTLYAGEIKKAMFTVMNYLLPDRDVLPMHCAANMGTDHTVTLFFGLSGAGKTTLSADPERLLIGDDEHGWSSSGIFNFEGGCYAKCINLSQKNEPLIWDALRTGTVMENVVLDSATNEARFEDDSLTQNSRAAYPLTYIDQRVDDAMGGHPNNVIFLTCDLYGVLPPVALLTKEQAAYYFLSGYTALVGSTEVGQSGIKPTFSVCFGAPFFPRPAQVYADLLMNKIITSGAKVWLVNTGWAGGAYGQGGKRFDIPTTRAVVKAIETGALEKAEFTLLPGFGFEIPKAIPGVDTQFVDPRQAWSSPELYSHTASELISALQQNFTKFAVSPEIIQAGPQL